MSQSIDYQEEISKCRTMEDITGPNGLIQRIIKDAVEQVLGREVDEYISSEKEKGNSASRNGSSHKTVKTAYGNIGVDIPRLREPGFEPEIIKKRAVVEDGLESQIISMYAKGMTVRDISEHIQALYGIELSAASISNITDKISDESKDWYSRTLDSFYPVIFLDAVHFKVREEGRIVTKAAYVALGINGEGYKDILGIWITGDVANVIFAVQVFGFFSVPAGPSDFSNSRITGALCFCCSINPCICPSKKGS